MQQTYYFGIHGESVGPLDELAIRAHVQEGKITRQTLAWCKAMDRWRPLSEIPELIAALEGVLIEVDGPPPLPTTAPSQNVPPPLPTEANATISAEKPSVDPMNPDYQIPQGLGALEAMAYQLVFWLYRPWRNRPSHVREFVRQDPKRAVPVAAVTLVVLFFLFCLAVYPIAQTMDNPPAVTGGQQQSMPVSAFGGDANIYQPMIEAQRYKQNIIDDVYRYNRDSFDRQVETYKQGTYDWYKKD